MGLEGDMKVSPKSSGHYIQNRTTEILVGVALFLIGAVLLYDAFDNRGKKMPWIASAITPW